jgi:hypothetical protein
MKPHTAGIVDAREHGGYWWWCDCGREGREPERADAAAALKRHHVEARVSK